MKKKFLSKKFDDPVYFTSKRASSPELRSRGSSGNNNTNGSMSMSEVVATFTPLDDEWSQILLGNTKKAKTKKHKFLNERNRNESPLCGSLAGSL